MAIARSGPGAWTKSVLELERWSWSVGAFAASFLVLFAPAPARAQALERGVPVRAYERIDDRRFAARPLVLEARAGFGTAVGLVGATATYNPWSFLGVGAGAGVSGAGGQVAALVQIRPITFVAKHWARLHGIGIELGYSTGPYTDTQIDVMGGGPVTGDSWDRVHWAQPMLFYETQSYRGFNLLAGVGAAIPFAASGYHCKVEPCGSARPGAQPSASVGFGYAWDGS